MLLVRQAGMVQFLCIVDKSDGFSLYLQTFLARKQYRVPFAPLKKHLDVLHEEHLAPGS